MECTSKTKFTTYSNLMIIMPRVILSESNDEQWNTGTCWDLDVQEESIGAKLDRAKRNVNH